MDIETLKLLTVAAFVFVAMVCFAIVCSRWEKRLKDWEDNLKEQESC